MKTISEIIKTVDSDEEIFERVEVCVNSMKINFVQLGFLFRVLKERGYNNDELQSRFGFSRSFVYRCIQVNERFSENGYSYKLDEKYIDFNKSQLIEMLPLTDEQCEEVTADMSIADIRELKNQDAEEPEEAAEPEQEEKESWYSADCPEVNQWIWNALSAIPEVGPNINKHENFAKSGKCKDILINADLGIYISRCESYGFCFCSDIVDIRFCEYVGLYQYTHDENILSQSVEPYVDAISAWNIQNEISEMLIKDIRDYDTLRHDNLFEYLTENQQLMFDIDDIRVSVGQKSFECTRGSSRHLSVSFKSVKDTFDSDFFELLNDFVYYAVEQYYDSNFNYLCDISGRALYEGIGTRDIEYLVVKPEDTPLEFYIFSRYGTLTEDYCLLPDDYFSNHDMSSYNALILNITKGKIMTSDLFKHFLESRECTEK